MSAVGSSEAPARRRRWSLPLPTWLDRTIRTVLLLVLLANAVGSVLPWLARPAAVEQLTADLRSGQVRMVTAVTGGTVRWTEDWWHWRQVQAPDAVDPDGWARTQVAAAGVDLEVEHGSGGPRGLIDTPHWLPLAVAGLAAGLAAFVLMVLRRERWLATGTGWFWMFVGGLGAPAYLLLEPEPLWARRDWQPPRWKRLPLGAWGGFLVGWVGVGTVLLALDLAFF